MNKLIVKDGTEIQYKDWGSGKPLVFHHGWPLSSDEWDTQLMFFLQHGFRVIAHDRRGHGRSSQSPDGHEMDTYASDVAELTAALDLRNAIHIGHSTGAGELVRYIHHAGQDRIEKAVLIGGVTPIMVQQTSNPEGVPMAVFNEIRLMTATQRSQYFKDFSLAFYGYNRPEATVQEGIRDNWWRQGMMGSIHAQYECIKAFSETDFTEDLKGIDLPVLVLHGQDDQIVPMELTAIKTAKLLKNATLITYPGLPHGMPTTHAATINKDILSFINS